MSTKALVEMHEPLPDGNICQISPRVIARAPEGAEALYLAQRCNARPTLLHVALNDRRLQRLSALVRFFAPRVTCLEFPAWDCLPYDRVSPKRHLLAIRGDCLSRLRESSLDESGPRKLVLLTTVNACVQRVPSLPFFDGRQLHSTSGAPLLFSSLTKFLPTQGYRHCESVKEKGDYAVRGGIVDFFPARATSPLRADFFGDVLEQLHHFDPITQRRTRNPVQRISIGPASEFFLDAQARQRFRTRWRNMFERKNALYEAVSNEQPAEGLAHWLPFLVDEMVSLFGCLPDGAEITFDEGAPSALQARLERVQDFYDSRKRLLEEARKERASTSSLYCPIPPEQLYLRSEEIAEILAHENSRIFRAGAQLPTERNSLDLQGRPASSYVPFFKRGGEKELGETLMKTLRSARKHRERVVFAAQGEGQETHRLRTFLRTLQLQNVVTASDWEEAKKLPVGVPILVSCPALRGFSLPGLRVIAEHDLFGRIRRCASARGTSTENLLTELSQLKEGDLVVHSDHGLGRYSGLQTLDVEGARHDCLRILYRGGDRLFVSVENMDVLSRHGVGGDSSELDRLGTSAWQSRKAHARKRLREMAVQLLRTAAGRAREHAPVLCSEEGYPEFVERFGEVETVDQQQAIDATLADLRSGKPMDRLICGDVGFGKTEVALRAAFVVASQGLQCMLLAPTTLLARQHTLRFQERFSGFPIRLAEFSRLVPAATRRKQRQALVEGKIDIAIGSHMLLEEHPRNPGLIIIDEEQRFGVRQKERLKKLRAQAHILTLTATPIPRTLQLALSGARAMSVIATPPPDRLSVRSFVLPWDPLVIREAIVREQRRDGQCFYVCPRIRDLDGALKRLRDLVPRSKVILAHGRLSAASLGKALSDFVEKKADILLATNIIESGLDIANANTIILHRSDLFGLAQLYQLRGRVGRSTERGYAYFTLPEKRQRTENAQRRLQVMQTLEGLGAGFQLAAHDLDIRGAGNFLGEEQSGHIREVGIELYQQMLREEIAAAKGEHVEEEASAPQISLGVAVLVSEDYVADLSLRLGLYRRLSGLRRRAEIANFSAELADRFGPLPEETRNLLLVVELKERCRELGVSRLRAGPRGAVLTFGPRGPKHPEALLSLARKEPTRIRLRHAPEPGLTWRADWLHPADRVAGVQTLLSKMDCPERAGRMRRDAPSD